MKLFKQNDKPLTAEQVGNLSPERMRIAKVLKKHIEAAVLELGSDYDVDLQGSYKAKANTSSCQRSRISQLAV